MFKKTLMRFRVISLFFCLREKGVTCAKYGERERERKKEEKNMMLMRRDEDKKVNVILPG